MTLTVTAEHLFWVAGGASLLIAVACLVVATAVTVARFVTDVNMHRERPGVPSPPSK